MKETPILNSHNKAEYPPMHTGGECIGHPAYCMRWQLRCLPCIGKHVNNTVEIGHIKLLSHDFQDGRWRIRFKQEGTLV